MRNLTLLTDLYQLTMMNGYLRNGKEKDVAVFDLFFRRNGIISYSVAAGLQQAADYVRGLHFEEEDIAYLRSLELFDESFLDYLKTFRFTGDLYAVPFSGIFHGKDAYRQGAGAGSAVSGNGAFEHRQSSDAHCDQGGESRIRGGG